MPIDVNSPLFSRSRGLGEGTLAAPGSSTRGTQATERRRDSHGDLRADGASVARSRHRTAESAANNSGASEGRLVVGRAGRVARWGEGPLLAQETRAKPGDRPARFPP